MTEAIQQRVRDLLATIVDPNTNQDLIAGGVVKGIGVDGNNIAIDIVLGYPAAGWHDELAALIRESLSNYELFGNVVVNVTSRVFAHEVQQELTPLPNVKNIIAIASGKGGVGKSTAAANLALALKAEGASVGVLDADIYGPSSRACWVCRGSPIRRTASASSRKQTHGIQVMSIGFMIEEDTAMIWRGPMVTQALQQLLGETNWVDLDYLIIDLPPGTGDIQLTLCQRVPVSGAIIVTTPQDIALLDASKALKMFEKVEVPVLGIIENMATHICSQCGHEEHIFGEGGGATHGRAVRSAVDRVVAARHPHPRTGRRRHAERRRDPDSDTAARYREIARKHGGAACRCMRATRRSSFRRSSCRN